MKANEAPEKIYLATTEEIQNLDNTFVGIAHSNPKDIIEPVEYIRNGAFIEKACEWLKSHYRDYMHNPTGNRLEAFFGMDMVEDLMKHLDNINLNNK